MASYFSFVHDSVRWPVYLKENSGTPLVKVAGEPLDESSPATPLLGYYRALANSWGEASTRNCRSPRGLTSRGALCVVKYKEEVQVGIDGSQMQ